MQAVIMAAGKGSRIASLHDGAPKCYLEINNKRLIDHQLDILNKNGISDVIMVVGYKKEMIKADYANRGITFIENPFYGAINVLSSFWFSLPFINDDFVYLHADTIFSPEIFYQMIRASGDIVLPIDFKECGEEEMKVHIENDIITEINKTMEFDHADGEFIGIAKINKELIPKLSKAANDILFNEEYNSFFESAIQKLIDIDKIKVAPLAITGMAWNEIDFEEDYLNTIESFKKS